MSRMKLLKRENVLYKKIISLQMPKIKKKEIYKIDYHCVPNSLIKIKSFSSLYSPTFISKR